MILLFIISKTTYGLHTKILILTDSLYKDRSTNTKQYRLITLLLQINSSNMLRSRVVLFNSLNNYYYFNVKAFESVVRYGKLTVLLNVGKPFCRLQKNLTD